MGGYPNIPAKEVAWGVRGADGSYVGRGQRAAGDALAAWAEGKAEGARRGAGGACGSRFTGGSRPRTGKTR